MSHHVRAQLIEYPRATTVGMARVDAVLTLPASLTADAPVWTPEPGHLSTTSGSPRYLEVATATVWAKPDGGRFHGIAHHENGSEQDFMLAGVMDAANLLGCGDVYANPGQLERRALHGILGSRPMSACHPLTWHAWRDTNRAGLLNPYWIIDPYLCTPKVIPAGGQGERS